MENLGDFFPSHHREESADGILKIGTVLRVFVNDTTPPKTKFIVVVGIDSGKLLMATVYINSEINPNVISSQELRDLQHKVEKESYIFLGRDSFVDCSSIAERAIDDLKNKLIQDSSIRKDDLTAQDISKIKSLLKFAKSIPIRIKKKYSLF